MAVPFYGMEHKDLPVYRLDQLDQSYDLFPGQFFNHMGIITRKGCIFQGDAIFLMFAVFPVITYRRIDYNGAQLGFERKRWIVFLEVLKHFQKRLVQDFFCFLIGRAVAQADSLGVTEKLLKQ